ncbi:MAG: hypothetical protein PF517_01955 [Salinivirgaceae bacterium]|jgi:hypothetical protein|nr:hypothetical protein [Salinivirgaceae bacterium]
MIKKTILFSLFGITTFLLNAQTASSSLSDENNLAILLTLCVALAALILAVVNSFRIAHQKKVLEVELVNQKDDLKVTMEAVKVNLSKDVRYLRKELGKTARNINPSSNADNNQAKSEKTDDSESGKPKPFKKRKPYYKKRTPYKKPNTDENSESK